MQSINKKLSLNASLSNPWKKFRSWEQKFNTNEFIQTSNYQNFYRSYGFSISYRFGKLDGGVKKNQRGISNDDVKGKSGGQQGG